MEQDRTEHDRTKALVWTILTHAEDFPWRMQDLGLLGLWLDDRREHRLHVWEPGRLPEDPPIHDHPFDFTSTVVVGELVNTRYVERASGSEYVRARYVPGSDHRRRVDTIRLEGTATTLGEGECYGQLGHELHDSRQVPGTVTIIRFAFTDVSDSELTVCHRPGAPWVSGQARDARPDEVKRITAAALAHFA
jgi:hypothetical protein